VHAEVSLVNLELAWLGSHLLCLESSVGDFG
jgi:hypothetical protein